MREVTGADVQILGVKQLLDYGPANSVVQVGCPILFLLFIFYFFNLFAFCGMGAESDIDM